MNELVIKPSEDPRYIDLYWEGERFQTVVRYLFYKPLSALELCQSREELQEIFCHLEDKLAKSEVIRLLARRSYFSSDLERKLKEKGFSLRAIQKVIQLAKEHHWLNDAEEVQRVVRRDLAKGKGSRVISLKLRQKKIDLSDVHCTREQELEALQQLLKKRYGKTNWKCPREKQKALIQLMRRGFSFEVIMIALTKS